MAKKKVVVTKTVKKSEVKPAANGKTNGVDETFKTKKTAVKRKVQVEEDEDNELPAPVPKGKRRKVKIEEQDEDAVELSNDGEAVEKKVKKKRKTKAEKAAEAMPLAPRTIGHKLFIGAHVSASGGKHL
jgi:AP endonuclease 1